ncbi:MAG: hypothetical protein LBP85_06980 [Prevotellaceae bacterium]|jgi:hypothetical protein|nr:hypothetical protein [Prevotellaceae bacterium]
MIFGNILWPEGKVNPSGIKSIAYYIPKSDIVLFPTIKNEDATTVAESVNYNGSFVLKEGKHFFSLYSTQGKGSYTSEATGEKDCKLFTNKVTLSYPDITDEGRNMMKGFVNANILLVIPLPQKRFVVLGSEDYDVDTAITGTTGDAPGSAKGLTIEVSAPDITPFPLYKGDLVLEDGTLDCLTGIFTPEDEDDT